ncbi:Hypothetical protein A7982_10103 [Minicystis rosea]|nr:Hypothetical protein A7982_10103 [Minicystis rosea]
MLTASILLLLIALLGAFDIAYFHWHRCRLARRAESRTEVWIHVARGVVYALQMALVPNVRFAGAWYAAFVALFVADVAIAMADVAVEPASRRSQGGIPGGEYLMHIVLSVLVGAYLHALFVDTVPWAELPTALTWAPVAPFGLRLALGGMAAGCLAVAAFEALALLFPEDARPRPLHVSVRLRAGVEEVWDVTQNHVLHPRWDHRFSRIEMLADRIETGTEMRYERSVLGLVIRGFGRYKLHRPLKQSTFEFWSESPLSLIRRGVGLWLYRPQDDGTVEFSTSYTYEVRWGLVGRVVDRLVFRPFFQRETERSFRRLTTMFFPEGASRVYGAAGRKPIRACSCDIVAAA